MSELSSGGIAIAWVVGVLLVATTVSHLGAREPADVRASNAPAAPYYPSARAGAAIAYDPLDRYVVLFSGSNGVNDTWTYSHGRWTELNETSAPTARTGACATWDGSDNYLLLFGGELDANGGGLVNDTWEFVHGQWTELHPAVSPPPLVWASCTYDANQGYVVLFGGTSTENTTTAQTWTFLGGTWTLQPPLASPHAVAPRFGAEMLFWGLGRYVDLYGGQGATAALTDSWEWTSTGWQAVNSGEPPEGRVLASVAYDTTTDVGVMFGGATAFNGSATSSMSTLGRSGRWSPAQPIGPPSPRLAAPFAYDASDGYFVLFGGWTSTSPSGPVLNDTWTYTGTNWTNITNSSDRPLPAPVPTPVPATSLTGIELGYIVAAIVVAALAIGLVAYWVRARRRSRPPMTGEPGPTGPPGAP